MSRDGALISRDAQSGASINFESNLYHFNPRSNERQVVRNAHFGAWGTEERHGGWPFKVGQEFTVTFTNQGTRVDVTVNGSAFATWTWRSSARPNRCM